MSIRGDSSVTVIRPEPQRGRAHLRYLWILFTLFSLLFELSPARSAEHVPYRHTRTARVLGREMQLWSDPDPSRLSEAGETWRITNARDKYTNNCSYHRVSSPFSPYGRYIVFSGRREEKTGLYLIDFGNAGRLVLLGEGQPARNNLWDLSGRRIYSRLRNPGPGRTYDLYMTDISHLPRIAERRLTRLHLRAGGMDGIWGLSADAKHAAFAYGVSELASSNDGRSAITAIATINAPGYVFERLGLSDALSEVKVRRRLAPTRNVKVFWLGNRYLVWGHKDNSDFPRAGHIHVLDLHRPPGHPEYDRVLAVGGHTIPHPDQLHFVTADGGRELSGKELSGAFTSWGKYDVTTGQRENLLTPHKSNGNHPNLSPDGRFLAVDFFWPKYHNWVSVLPLDGKSAPILLAEHGMHPIPLVKHKRTSRVPWDLGEPFHHVSVHWSPDGTKIVWGSTAAAKDPYKHHVDIFVTIFRLPDPVSNFVVQGNNGANTLQWQPPTMHREVKEYRVYRRTGSAPERTLTSVQMPFTYLAESIGPHEQPHSIPVESTAGFPNDGIIEMQPTGTADSVELVRYSGKANRAFLNVQWGVYSTGCREHYSGSRVVLSPREQGYVDRQAPVNSVYAIEVVDWFGLVSLRATSSAIGIH